MCFGRKGLKGLKMSDRVKLMRKGEEGWWLQMLGVYASGEDESLDWGVIKKLKASCLWLLRIRAWEGDRPSLSNY